MDDSKNMPAVERTSRIGFGMTDREVMRDPTLPPMAKLVYAYLATCPGDTRSAFPSLERIAEELGISVQRVTNAIKQAEEAGILTQATDDYRSAGTGA